MITSNLRFPPVKRYGTLPDKLIYHTVEDYNPSIDRFIMFSTKRGDNRIARMICFPQSIYRDGKMHVPSLYVCKLFAPGGGFGTAMLNFARVYSKMIGCGGNIHLQASGCYMPQRVPHIFYRKYGMNTSYEAINKKLNKFVEKGKSATYMDFDEIEMYYPPIKIFPHKENKILKIIKKFFKIGKIGLN